MGLSLSPGFHIPVLPDFPCPLCPRPPSGLCRVPWDSWCSWRRMRTSASAVSQRGTGSPGSRAALLTVLQASVSAQGSLLLPLSPLHFWCKGGLVLESNSCEFDPIKAAWTRARRGHTAVSPVSPTQAGRTGRRHPANAEVLAKGVFTTK